MLTVALSCSGWIGAEVMRGVVGEDGISLAAVFCPPTGRCADLARFYLEDGATKCVNHRQPEARDIPDGCDLIVTAGSRWFVSERVRHACRLGGIGYHPSLLPIHRGADAVEWAIRMGDRVTGGTVYKLTNKVDAGGIIAQRHVFIKRGETAPELWRRCLAQLGVDLLMESLRKVLSEDFVSGTPQDESMATWEPSIGRPPIHRPDLLLIGRDTGAAGVK